ncbi:MAG: hydrogenase formation protein HypD [Candidatus Njordarchaeota archaeon]
MSMNIKEMLSALRSRDTIKIFVRKIDQIFRSIKRDVGAIKIMNFCGTHEFAITYYGIRSLMPEGLELIAGPGCPVCVTPAKEVDEAIEMSKYATVLTYGDMYKVPGTRMSLSRMRSQGGSVEIVYGFYDAVKEAKKNRNKDFVFFAVGFETTAPTVASYVAKRLVPKNLYILMSYRITVPIMRYILSSGRRDIYGIIAPGHVSTITGAGAWKFVASEFGVPIVVAGFEPLDVVMAIYEILKQIHEGKPRLVNEYKRAVTWEGNKIAKKFIEEAFKVVDGSWRGIGVVARSVWNLRDEFEYIDARKRFDIKIRESIDIKPGCKCAEINLGLAKPTDCQYFGKACTPEHPIGPCMVSAEGACSIWFKYGGYEIIKAKK